MRYLVYGLFVILSMTACNTKQDNRRRDARVPSDCSIEAKVERLLGQMTLEEKIV